MTKKAVRAAIILLTLITAGVHLAILGIGILEESGSIDFLFILNGLGYLTLLGFLLFGFPWGGDLFVRFAFIAYTLITTVAWFVLNGDFSEPLGVFTKAVEVLLIVFLWTYMQRTPITSSEN